MILPDNYFALGDTEAVHVNVIHFICYLQPYENICETVIFKIEVMRQMLNCQTTSGNSLTKFENVEWRYFSLSVLAIQKLYFGLVY